MKRMSGEFTLDQIKEAHCIAAKVVALHGDRYLPIFQRVHAELIQYEKMMAVKNIALSVASGMMENDKTEVKVPYTGSYTF